MPATPEELEMLRLQVKLAKLQGRQVFWKAIAEWWPLMVIMGATVAPILVALIAVMFGADLD